MLQDVRGFREGALDLQQKMLWTSPVDPALPLLASSYLALSSLIYSAHVYSILL